MKLKFNSINFKIHILYTAILGITLIIYSSAIYFSLSLTLYKDLDNELRTKAKYIKEMIKTYQAPYSNNASLQLALRKTITLTYLPLSALTPENIDYQWLLKIDKLDLTKDYIVFFTSTGAQLAHSLNSSSELIKFFKKELHHREKIKDTIKNISYNKRNLRILQTRLDYSGSEKKYILMIATSLNTTIEMLQNRFRFISICTLILLLLGAIISKLFAYDILKPLNEIIKVTERITHDNLKIRLLHNYNDKEINTLAQSFNNMIARLENSFNYINDFSSHVAHELKTPLAIIRGESEIVLRRNRAAQEYKKALLLNLEEVEKMLKVIDDLLLSTRVEFKTDVFQFSEFDLNILLDEVYQRSLRIAEKKEININYTKPQEKILISADKLHLRRLFFNLIDNAIKFTPPQGTVNISLDAENAKAKIIVSDTGMGIEQEDLPKIFDRFFRGQQSRAKNEPGTGLGLNIAYAIAKIHKGEINVKSEIHKGATFTVVLPIIPNNITP